MEMRDGSVQSASLLEYVCDDGDYVRNLTSLIVMKIKSFFLKGTIIPRARFGLKILMDKEYCKA